MFKKGFCLFLDLALLLTALSGCSRSENYLDFTDDLLVVYSSSPTYYGPSDYSYVITIYNDGRGLYQENAVVMTDDGESCLCEESLEFSMDETAVVGIQNSIVRAGFMGLEENLDTDSLDGAYVYITVYANGTEHKSGGLNPEDKRFERVRSTVLSVVPKSTIEECNAKLQSALSDKQCFDRALAIQ